MKKFYMLLMLLFAQTKSYAQTIIFKNIHKQTIFTCNNSDPRSCVMDSNINLKNKNRHIMNIELAQAIQNGRLNDFLITTGVLEIEYSADGVLSKTCGSDE